MSERFNIISVFKIKLLCKNIKSGEIYPFLHLMKKGSRIQTKAVYESPAEKKLHLELFSKHLHGANELQLF